MTIWIDAQLSPLLAKWIESNFAIPAIAVRVEKLLSKYLGQQANGADGVPPCRPPSPYQMNEFE